MLTLKHLGLIQQKDTYLGATLKSIQDAINYHGQVGGIDPTGQYPTPRAPSGLSVQASNGFFDVVITDGNPVRGVEYWLEWDTVSSFPAPRQIHLVAARNWYGNLGNQTLYWRAASQFPGSNLSDWVVYGGANPIAVVGGGSAGPAPMATSGSGAGQGRGVNPFPPVGVGRGPIERSRKELAGDIG